MRRPLDAKHLALLDELEPGLDAMELRRHLDSRIPAETARAISEQVALRGRANTKFESPFGLLLTPKGLEQATPLAIARRRASLLAGRIREARAEGLVLDATAGLGADAIAIAESGLELVAAEADPATAYCLSQNLRSRGLRARVLIARLEDRVVEAPFLMVDPDRRAGDGARIGDPEQWSPPLSAVLAAVDRCLGAIVKLAPGTDVSDIEREAQRRGPVSLEWVAWGGELKEVTLWTGLLCPPDRSRRAVSLRPGGVEATFSATPEELALSPPPLSPAEARAIQWLSEPEASVVRAGMVGAMAARVGARAVGPQIAYLGSVERPEAPLLATYRVLGTAQADRRRVRALLAAHDVGKITVKRRGHPLDAEELAKRFRGPGSRRGLLVIARLERGHQAWLVEREGPKKGKP